MSISYWSSAIYQDPCTLVPGPLTDTQSLTTYFSDNPHHQSQSWSGWKVSETHPGEHTAEHGKCRVRASHEGGGQGVEGTSVSIYLKHCFYVVVIVPF